MPPVTISGTPRRAASALTAADAEALAALDPTLAAELMVNGRAAWQLAAGALAARPDDVETRVRGTRYYKEAPYGVGYTVVGWNERA